ncbi:unnamed protein product, partial [Ectocarpus sp. 12 AP-2014]
PPIECACLHKPTFHEGVGLLDAVARSQNTSALLAAPLPEENSVVRSGTCFTISQTRRLCSTRQPTSTHLHMEFESITTPSYILLSIHSFRKHHSSLQARPVEHVPRS